MSWGHAVSKDLITWTDIHDWRDASSQALVGNLNGVPYDKLGIFSGTAQPVNLKGQQDGTLLMLYTAISALPTNWKIPYIPGTEKQAYAISKDGGKSWRRYEKNPVLSAPPTGWNVCLQSFLKILVVVCDFLINYMYCRLLVGEILSSSPSPSSTFFSRKKKHTSTWY